MTLDSFLQLPDPQSEPSQPSLDAEPQRRRQHRERDFGIGYGTSSGYGRDRRFFHFHDDALFRCR